MRKFINLLSITVLIFSFFSCSYFPELTDFENPINKRPIDIKEDHIDTDKKSVDVLLVCYMDGDNNLHSLIQNDLHEAVEGYNLIPTNDNVDVIVLWDDFGFGNTKLCKVGKDNILYDISSDAPFLQTKNSLGEVVNEVSMNDYNTLTSYLTWIKEHYTYNSIILQVSDHGAGPGSYDSNSRAICQDVNPVFPKNKYELLGSKDIPHAIKMSGIGKVDLFIQDVCLGSTVEEIYEYKDVAEYMLLSPNLMPGDGLNYINLVSTLTSDISINDKKLDVEKYINENVKRFITTYKNPQVKWEELRIELGGNKISDLQLSLAPLKRFQSYLYWNNARVSTITGVEVEKIVDLKDAINSLLFTIKKYKDETFIITENDKETVATLYKTLKLKMKDMDYYLGSWGPLYDLGFLCDEIIALGKINKLTSLIDSCNNVKKQLDNVVVASWRDGVGGALYNKSICESLNGIAPYDKGTYGIAIAGFQYIEECGKGYTENLSFSKDSFWLKFMEDVKWAE